MIDLPLVSTKLYIPPPRPGLLPRPRLMERLDAAGDARLILVSALPGAGKTVLLSQWVHIRPGTRAAWVSLDEGDNDPVRFLGYVLAALQSVEPKLGAGLSALLGSPQPPPLDAMLATIVNDAAQLPDPLLLVLDDYHSIAEPAVHRAVTFLLDHAPPQVRVAIGTRADPPLPLARLRARGQLAEIRTTDLSFDPAEASELLNRCLALALREDDVLTLTRRTEGWAVGLQMAGLSLRSQPPAGRHESVAAFAGDDRHVVDYVVEEVLLRQPEPVQAFLLQTSILDRLCGPLCDAVTGSGDGRHMLEHLERANLFLVPLDGRREWYRYHHLLADLLRRRLERDRAGHTVALHARAANWYEQNGLTADAIHHARAARDFERMARLVESAGWTFAWHGEMATLAGWLAALPGEMVNRRPRLGLVRAWLSLGAMQLGAAEQQLGEVERRVGADASSDEARTVLGEVAALRATVAGMGGDAAAAVDLALRALELLPADDARTRGIVFNTLGTAYETLGQPLEAAGAYSDGAALSQAAGNALVALIAMGNISRLYQGMGLLGQAEAVCRHALDLAAARGAERVPSAGMAHVGLAMVYYEWNDLDNAASHLAEGMDLGRRAGIAELVAAGCTLLVQLCAARGDVAGAWRALAEAEQLVAQRTVSAGIAAAVSACRARLLARAADADQAGQWIAACGLAPTDDPHPMRRAEYVALARLLIAIGEPGRAAGLLSKLHLAARQQGQAGEELEILVLYALSLRAQGETAGAAGVLGSALALAAAEGHTRTFLDEGEPLRQLLLSVQPQPTLRLAVDRLLAAFSRQPPIPTEGSPQSPIPDPSVEPLSPREIEFLRLLAAGLSNAEIAGRLVVTVGTAKWHAVNIYGKLGVHSRTQAVARARDLGLI